MECVICHKVIDKNSTIVFEYQSADIGICEQCMNLNVAFINAKDMYTRGSKLEKAIDAFTLSDKLSETSSIEAPEDFLSPQHVPSPKELYNYLSEFVIGQNDAKKNLSIEVYNHYQRLLDSIQPNSVLDEEKFSHLKDVEIGKSNILLIGPTGTGKTLLAQALAKKLDVPFAIGDATTLTEAGYVGEDVENLVLNLLANADFDVDRAEKGIIFIDEIDKIRSSGSNVSITRDVSGSGVQQSLLKMIEGKVCNVPPQGGRKHPHQDFIQLDTSNILFILGGSFDGLEDIIRRRLNLSRIGFSNKSKNGKQTVEDYNEIIQQVAVEDLIEFGMIPELIGRLPVISTLQKLSKKDLIRILIEPKNSLLAQEKKKMALRNIALEFDDDAIETIAEVAYKNGTGARSLRSIVSKFMNNICFDLSENFSGDLRITKEIVLSGNFSTAC